MKKLISSKKTVQKILIVIVMAILINFVLPTYSHADFGGVLAGPFTDFFSMLGDVAIASLQMFMVDGLKGVDGSVLGWRYW